MNKDFVRVKTCHIPGFFNENIDVLVEDTVPDEVVTEYAKSLVLGGNFRTNELTLTKPFKMKVKEFNKCKTDIPEKFYLKTPILEDVSVIPFKPHSNYPVVNAKEYTEQYLVDYTYIEASFLKSGKEIFCTQNSRDAHQQVENFAKSYLQTVAGLNQVEVTSVTYC